MDWLNTKTALSGHPDFLAATTHQEGVWHRLAKYCATQENGGRIDRCDEWTDTQWIRSCGITEGEAKMESPLWKWDMKGIVVRHYPISQEREVARKREAGRRTAKLRWDHKKAKQDKALTPNKVAQFVAQL